ncbi:hypothetical protein HELRODRAFT_170736 [Helobdella robusta]|uniref:Major facilitator superfamily domain-containing protein 4A n=1 Tax=Helobdella robusta TaxID=6412 RepID=T1F3D3_HELRO|nr:hypothetical protein HELRODRAFT_170736 [Helobdella robusta]ESO07402.1 hypothetical protein HELRODRAFT_170736 [Helobdella robusta]
MDPTTPRFQPEQTPSSPLLQHNNNNKYHNNNNPFTSSSSTEATQQLQQQPPRPPPPNTTTTTTTPQQQQQNEQRQPSSPPKQNNNNQQHKHHTALHVTTSAAVAATTFRQLFRQYWQEAVTYCAVFWTFGMCVAFLGPTLLDIGCMISSGLQTTTWAFTSQLLFSLIGATLAGYVVDKIDANIILFINTLLVPLSMAFLPFSRSIWSLTAILALMGLNMGFIDCIANLQMFNVFGDSVAPFLHALHFCYGIGAFVSPVISEPYLLNEDCTVFVETVTDEPNLVVDAQSGLVMYRNDSGEPASTLEEAQEMTKVKYAFWIMSAIQAPVAILVFLLVHKMRSRGWMPVQQEVAQIEVVATDQALIEKKLKELEQSNLKTAERLMFMSERKQVIAITVGTATLMFIYDGLQSAFGGYIYAYAVKSIVDLSKTEGAYLNALFWGMFALGRLISIYLATKFTPAFMLLCNIMGCMLSMTLILLLRHNHVILYLGTGVYGLALSSVAPSTISMAEQYIDVNYHMTLADWTMMLFARVGPHSFLIFCSTMGFVSMAVYAGIWVIGRTTPKHIATANSSFVWCRMCIIDKTTPGHGVRRRSLAAPPDSAPTPGEIEMEPVNHS